VVDAEWLKLQQSGKYIILSVFNEQCRSYERKQLSEEQIDLGVLQSIVVFDIILYLILNCRTWPSPCPTTSSTALTTPTLWATRSAPQPCLGEADFLAKLCKFFAWIAVFRKKTLYWDFSTQFINWTNLKQNFGFLLHVI